MLHLYESIVLGLRNYFLSIELEDRSSTSNVYLLENKTFA